MTFQYVHGLQDEITNFLTDTLRRRRLRDDYLSPEILSDPSWDMMLDLYLSERRGREVTVSSLCIASCAPFTTALRWIAKLEGKGLICRLPVPNDRRSSQMLLTDQGRAAMEGWARHAMRPPAAAEPDLRGKLG
jgi:DNA-binding MarR family transcriptional regulator